MHRASTVPLRKRIVEATRNAVAGGAGRRFLALSFVFLALLIVTGTAGSFIPPLGRTLGVVALLIAIAVRAPYRSLGRALGALAVVAATALLSTGLPGMEGTAILVLGFLTASAIAGGDARVLCARDIFGVAGFFGLLLASQRIDVLWYAIQSLGRGQAAAAAYLLPVAPRFGPTAGGTYLTLAALSCLVAGLCGERRRSWRTWLRAGVSTGILLCLPIAITVTAVELTGFRTYRNGTFEAAEPFLVQMLFAPVAAFVVALAFQGASMSAPMPSPLRFGGRTPAVVIPLLAIVAVPFLLAASRGPSDGASPKNVLFVERSRGLNDYRAPDWNQPPGFGASGLYGTLLNLLERSGRATAIEDKPLSAADLSDVGTLVVIDPIVPFTADETARIHRFVDGGGSLLVLADHTDLMGLMGSTNAIIGRYGMELRFDTAMETLRAFQGNLEVRPTGVFEGAIDPIELQVLHGASLKIRPPASPLIVGRTTFGDFGDRHNDGAGGYLGDYRFLPAVEASGDLVLAASALSGRGRVIVFGDTSTFQNVAIARSCAAALDVFDWLDGISDGKGAFGVLALLSAMLLLFGGLVRPLATILPGLGLLTLIVGCGLSGGTAREAGNARIVDRLARNDAFLLHTGHLPAFDIDQFQRRSIEGLLIAATRSGLVGVAGDLRHVEDLSKARVICIDAPGRTLDGPTMRRLDAYMRGGGTVLLATGHPQSATSADFLARYGFRILPVPLGAAPVLAPHETRDYKGPEFAEAWPVALTAEGGSGETVTRHFEVDGYAIVASRPVGDGRLVVIGDSWFLTDKHFENESTAKSANVQLLASVLGWQLPKTETSR